MAILGSISPGSHLARAILVLFNLLVLAHAPPAKPQAGQDCQARASDDDTTTSLVAWLLGAKEEIRREPM